jgi:hypothetical protein
MAEGSHEGVRHYLGIRQVSQGGCSPMSATRGAGSSDIDVKTTLFKGGEDERV